MSDKELAAIMESDADLETMVTEGSAPPEVEAPEETPEIEAVESEETPEAVEEPEKKQTGIDKRFRKLTTKISTLESRAEAAERERDLLQQKLQPIEAEPTLEQFDYDEEAHNRAMIRHYAKLEVNQVRQEEQQRKQEASKKRVAEDFAHRVDEAGIEGYEEKMETLIMSFTESNPMPWTMVEAIQLEEKGPEVVAFLSANTDKAHSIATMPALKQAAEIGKISAMLSQSSPKQTTKAPPPVETAGSGGALSTPLDKITDIDQMMAKLETMDDI